MNQSSQPRSFKYRPSLSITDGGSTHRYLKSSYSSHIAREDTHLLLKNQRPTSSSTSHHQLPYISTHHENTITSNTMNYATMNPPEEDPTFDSKKQGPKINIEVHDSATPSLSHRNRNIIFILSAIFGLYTSFLMAILPVIFLFAIFDSSPNDSSPNKSAFCDNLLVVTSIVTIIITGTFMAWYKHEFRPRVRDMGWVFPIFIISQIA